MTQIYRQTKDTYERLGKKYTESISKLTPEEFDVFCTMLPKNASILDIGCAGGRDSIKFVEHGYLVTGIDVVEKFLHEASLYVPEAIFRNIDVLDLKLDPNSFDGAWANAILLHLKTSDQEKALSNIFRVLKKHGLLFVSFKLGSQEAIVKDVLSQGNDRYFNFITSQKAIEMVESSGFKVLQQRMLKDPIGRPDVSWIRIIAKKI